MITLLFSRRAQIAPPSEFVTPPFGGGDDIEPTVAVKIGNNDLIGLGPVVLKDLHIPWASGVAAVLEEGYPSMIAPTRRNDLDIAVPVNVRSHGFKSVHKLFADDVPLPGATLGTPVVLVPDNPMMPAILRSPHAFGHDYVHVAVGSHRCIRT